MNNLLSYDWADSRIEKITVSADAVRIQLLHDALRRNVVIECRETIGMTNLCLWDDVYVDTIDLKTGAADEPLVKEAKRSCGTEQLSGNKPIKAGYYTLSVTLANHITWKIYCYDVRCMNE